MRSIAQVTHQLVILGVERVQQIAAKFLRRVLALKVQIKVAAFALRKIGLRIRFALGPSQILFYRRIRPQRQRFLPGANRIRSMIAGKLHKAQHGDSVRRAGSNTGSMLRVGQSLRRVACAHKSGRVIDQQRGIIRLKSKRRFVIPPGCREVAPIGFMLAGKKVGGSRDFRIRRLRQDGERIGIDFAGANHFYSYVGFVIERGGGRGDVRSDVPTNIRSIRTGKAGTGRPGAARINVIDGRFRNGVGILANLILDMVFIFIFIVIFIFADLIRPNGAPILKMNDVGSRRNRRQQH